MTDIRVRVRGIAATALTKILMDKGYVIVQASPIIRERFNIPLNTEPADVTVKDGDLDELLVLGFHDCADKVFNDIAETIEYPLRWVSPVGLHSIHVGVVRQRRGDKCLVEIAGGVVGVLHDCMLDEGKKVLVGVVKPSIKPFEETILTRHIRVVGKYVSLIHGKPQLSVSEHIRDPEIKNFLLAIGVSKTMGSGLGVHFRSSSRYADRDSIEEEIEELKKLLRDIVDKYKRTTTAPQQLYSGEFIGLIGLTSTAKKTLDKIRDQVIPTISGHHSYKSHGGVMSDITDYAEKLLAKNIEEQLVVDALKEYIIEKSITGKTSIIHIKPTGEVLELSPGKIIDAEPGREGYRIVIERIFRKPGIYDGLGIEKKPGDIDYMVIYENKWFITHNYYRGEEYLGTYVNINTPPEILPNTIKYHDLAVDIVVKPGKQPEVIDYEELNNYLEKGIITQKLYEKTLETLDDLRKNIHQYIFRPEIQHEEHSMRK